MRLEYLLSREKIYYTRYTLLIFLYLKDNPKDEPSEVLQFEMIGIDREVKGKVILLSHYSILTTQYIVS